MNMHDSFARRSIAFFAPIALFASLASAQAGSIKAHSEQGRAHINPLADGGSGGPTSPGGGACVADVDDGYASGRPDGGVTIDDLIYYLYCFETGLIAADVDDGSATGLRDGGITIDDLLYFLYRFESGC